ncbi:MFS general substrate transporter [Aureobasidium melanogenum CBS 110374]|uniref:MFS general substrate transporter n=1 Tax=Aureobasidium melanogenum (strain CBS 110374) TaxID=1043003 RepID=A0A074WNN4_AURM1|nr:MFS general substrate transporter [Aureobasidium melanogenum CBS 110374]KEQ64086.1 MFS general substrate transporter [Aureobasidium melanogenum CBS 110374]
MSVLISFAENDSENPFKWSRTKKLFIVTIGIVAILNSTLDSSLPSGAIKLIAKDFEVTQDIQLVLPISVYLVGYILGPLFFSPLSERYGRRLVLVPTFVLFTAFTGACAGARNWASFLVFRLICGINASSSIAITSGIYADIFEDPVVRGRAIAFYISATAFGPQFAPVISGALSSVGWRWTFWVALVIAAVSLVPIVFLPETYKPVILRRKARRLRSLNPDCHVYAPIEMGKQDLQEMVTITLARPIRMFCTEIIVFLSSVYLAFISGVYFLLFEAYPIIYQDIYGMGLVSTGLAFVPIAVGCIVAFLISLAWDRFFRNAHAQGRSFTTVREYKRLPLACIGAPLCVVSVFWMGWSSSPRVHWIVPMLAGALFGAGFVLIFMALLNYMTDAFPEFAASASAAASCTRSVFGALLPLAAPRMYANLGIDLGMTVLGFVSLILSLVPFGLLWLGKQGRL